MISSKRQKNISKLCKLYISWISWPALNLKQEIYSNVTSNANVYRLVLETLEPLPGDRKCFRMINGVLTERTVKEVIPILQTNSDGLKKALEELVKQYKSKQDEMEKWKVCVDPSPERCLYNFPFGH